MRLKRFSCEAALPSVICTTLASGTSSPDLPERT